METAAAEVAENEDGWFGGKPKERVNSRSGTARSFDLRKNRGFARLHDDPVAPAFFGPVQRTVGKLEQFFGARRLLG